MGLRHGKIQAMIELISRTPGRHWGFAHVRVHTEKKVRTFLDAMGIPHYLPTLPKARMHHSTKIISEIPMIPGYIFLCADDNERADLRRREKRFVHIELLRDPCLEDVFIEELNALRRCEILAREEPILVNPDIVAGDEVLITAGHLQGLRTTVCARDNEHNTIIVNLTILNKHVEYPVSAETLQKITTSSTRD